MPRKPSIEKKQGIVRMRIFNEDSSLYKIGPEVDSYNAFILTARQAEMKRFIRHDGYLTLNTAAIGIDLKGFPDGNILGWTNPDVRIFDIKPITSDNRPTTFEIIFENLEELTVERMKEILGE